jgi:hypothetical protein
MYRLLLREPLVRARIFATTNLQVSLAGRVAQFAHGQPFIHGFTTRRSLRSFGGFSVLVGTAEEILADTGSDDLTGRVAVTPGTVDRVSASRLRDRGAIAIVQLTGTEDLFNDIRGHLGPSRIFLADSTIESSYAPPLPSLILNSQLSQNLYRSLNAGAEVHLRYRLETALNELLEYNVGCVLPGTSDSAIVFTAHYDHLGIRDTTTTSDSIYNGFSDNAAGVGMLLAIAQTAASMTRRLDSDLVFLFFTGEELGLLGSDYFVERPPIPLDRFRAVINLDAGAPPAPPTTWRIAGGDSSALGAVAVETATSEGWTATVSPAVPNSDYFPFWRKNVPSVFLIPGAGAFEGLTADSSDALRRRWDRYHRPDDEWHTDFPLSGVARYAEFAYLVALAVERGRSGQDPNK